MEMEDVQISYDTSESQGFVFEFKTFCTILHDNLLKDGKFHQIMTSDVEKGLVQYLLTPQDDASCSEELSNWLQQYVFCVVSNEEQTTFELHIWMDDQKRVASIENYYTMLSSLYSQLGRVTPEYFLKKVNENYALLPEEVTMYFINHCIGHKESKTKAVPKSHENKENLVYGCKIISYEYIKQKVIKRKVLTEVFNKTSGKVVQSKCQEEDPSDDFIYCVQKNEKLCDITNTKRTEVSTTNYTSNQALEVKFLNRTVLAYFPPDEMQNHDHLVTLSDLIYKDQEISSVNTDEIQMEFIVPQKLPEKCMVDLQSIFSTSENKSLFPESDHVYEKSSSKKMKKAVKKPKTTPGNPKIVVNPPGKLTIVTDKNNKGATLKCIPVDFIAETPPQELSYSALSAAAGPAEEPDENDGDGVFNHLENDVTMDDNVTEKMADTISKQIKRDLEEVKQNKDQRLVDKTESLRRKEVTTNAGSNNKDLLVIPTDAHMSNVIQKSTEKIKAEVLFEETTINHIHIIYDAVSCTDTTKQKKILEREVDIVDTNSDYLPLSDGDCSPNKEHTAREQRTVDGLTCKFCYKKYSVSSSRYSHEVKWCNKNPHRPKAKRKSRGNVDLFTCRYCDKKYTVISSRYHHEIKWCTKNPNRRVDVGSNYVCQYCSASFSKRNTLHTHKRRCPLDPGRPDKTCDICKEKVLYEKFGQHMRLHYQNKEAESPTLPCNLCDKSFTDKTSLRRHRQSAHLPNEKKVGLINIGPLVCHICGMLLKSDVCLKLHLKRHEDKTILKCDECDKTFNDKSSLKDHVLSHRGDPAVSCNQCGKLFYTAAKVKKHVYFVHTPKRFHCDACQRGFTCPRDFEDHTRLHTGEKPFNCPDCSKSFRTRTMMKTHRKVHTDNRIRKHECGLCEKTFLHKNNLLVHLKIHSPLKKLQERKQPNK